MIRSVNRFVNTILQLSLVDVMDKVKENLPSTKAAYEFNDGLMKGKLLPSLQQIEYFLNVLLSVARLSKRVVSFSPNVFQTLSHDIGKGLFMSFNMVALALISRLSSVCECLFSAVAHCFTAWTPALKWTQSVGVVFVRN